MSTPTVHVLSQPAFAVDPGVVAIAQGDEPSGGTLRTDQILLAGGIGVGAGALLMAGAHHLHSLHRKRTTEAVHLDALGRLF